MTRFLVTLILIFLGYAALPTEAQKPIKNISKIAFENIITTINGSDVDPSLPLCNDLKWTHTAAALDAIKDENLCN